MKLFFLDIDGTILSIKSGISKKTKYAIQQLRKNGHKVFLCSGRHISIVDHSVLENEFDGFVLANGAFIYYDGQYVLNESINPKQVKEIVELSKKNGYIYYLEALDVVYTNDVTDKRHQEFIKVWRIPDNFSDQIDYSKKINIGMLFYFKEDHFESISNQFQDSLILAPHHSFPSCDLNVIGTNKAKGIETLLKFGNFKHQDTIAFGDGLNDIEMLEYVQMGVAMGNAHESVKAVANDITETVEEDGVYQYLVKHQYIERMKD